jgi:hypothetical protein
MSTPTSKVRKTFFGLWIVTAVVLLMAGRAGGTVGALDARGLAPVAAESLLPVNAVRSADLGSVVAD